LSFFTNLQINQIANIALQAGEIAKEFFYQKNFIVNTKPDQSKVTSADIEVSNFIYKSLGNSFPKIPTICEEQNNAQFSKEAFFLIDPIDGTSGYIKNSDQFSINIALVKNQKPIFGLIYAPIFEGGKLFLSSADDNLLKYHDLLRKTEKIVKEDIEISNFKPDVIKKIDTKVSSLRIITSKRSHDSDLIKFVKQFYPQNINNYSLVKRSSAIKFFDILENKADIYIHFNQTMEWDTAAGHALIKLINISAKKISIIDDDFIIGNDLDYGKLDYLNSSFVIF